MQIIQSFHFNLTGMQIKDTLYYDHTHNTSKNESHDYLKNQNPQSAKNTYYITEDRHIVFIKLCSPHP